MKQDILRAKSLRINDPIMIARYIRATNPYWAKYSYKAVKELVLANI